MSQAWDESWVGLLAFRSVFDLNASAPDPTDHNAAAGRTKSGTGATVELDSTQQLMAGFWSFTDIPIFGNY
jgi:hypothetical protein